MPEIVIVKKGPVPESMADAMRGFLFGDVVDGLGPMNQSRWRRFWSGVVRAEVGECMSIITHRPRSGVFHRRHMALEAEVFDCQERIADFDQFRVWLKIGAGHVDWLPGPKGGIVPVPRSISYASLEEDQMREFHESVVRFLRTPKACKTLWPHAQAADRERYVEQILEGFGE